MNRIKNRGFMVILALLQTNHSLERIMLSHNHISHGEMLVKLSFILANKSNTFLSLKHNTFSSRYREEIAERCPKKTDLHSKPKIIPNQTKLSKKDLKKYSCSRRYRTQYLLKMSIFILAVVIAYLLIFK